MNSQEIFESFTISTDVADALISAFIHEAYNLHGDNDSLVASEILFLADQENASAFASPSNLEKIENILLSAGGARRHQCMFQFTMKIGS